MSEEGEQTVVGDDGNPVPSSDDKLWVVAAHLGPILLGFIAPLVVWLVKKDESEFIEDQAKESLNFQITVFIAYAVAGVLSCLAIGLLLFPIIYVGMIVLCVIATIKSNEGERYRYPFALRLIP